MPDQGTQRCLDDAGKTCRRPSLSRRRESNCCHDNGKKEQTPRTMVGLKTPPGRQQKRRVDAVTYSDRPQSSLSILLLVLYKSGDAKCNVVGFYEVKNSLSKRTLFIPVFSLLSLSLCLFLSGLAHTLLS